MENNEENKGKEVSEAAQNDTLPEGNEILRSKMLQAYGLKFQGLTTVEIAAKMGVGESTVKRWIRELRASEVSNDMKEIMDHFDANIFWSEQFKGLALARQLLIKNANPSNVVDVVDRLSKTQDKQIEFFERLGQVRKYGGLTEVANTASDDSGKLLNVNFNQFINERNIDVDSLKSSGFLIPADQKEDGQ